MYESYRALAAPHIHRAFEACDRHPEKRRRIVCMTCGACDCDSCATNHPCARSHEQCPPPLVLVRYMYNTGVTVAQMPGIEKSVRTYVCNGKQCVMLRRFQQHMVLDASPRRCRGCSNGVPEHTPSTVRYCSVECVLVGSDKGDNDGNGERRWRVPGAVAGTRRRRKQGRPARARMD